MPPGLRRNFWDDYEPASLVNVDCFLPTGVVIQLQVRIEAPLSEIKNRLWREASSYPLFNFLKDAANYIFVCVNQRGKQEELLDETRQLIDVRPFRPLLKLVQKQGDNEEKLFDSHIGNLIGKSLHEFDQMQNTEVDDFRRKYRQFAEKIACERRQLDWIGRAMYAYPPEVESTDPPERIEEKLMENRRFLVNVAIKNNRASIKDMHAFNVPADAYPDELLVLVLRKRGAIMGVLDLDKPSDYVLKIVGQESYLLGNYPLLQYTVCWGWSATCMLYTKCMCVLDNPFFPFNPVHPDIGVHVLHTGHHAFSKVPTWKICVTCKGIWSFRSKSFWYKWKSICYLCKVDSIQTQVTSSRFDTEYYTIYKWPNKPSKTYSLDHQSKDKPLL